MWRCGKQMKCPVEIANEVSGLAAGVEIMLRLRKRRTDEAISGSGSGADRESQDGERTSDQRKHSMAAGSKADTRGFSLAAQADPTCEQRAVPPTSTPTS